MLKKINNTSCFFHHVTAIVGKLAGIKLITTVQPCLLCNCKPTSISNLLCNTFFSQVITVAYIPTLNFREIMTLSYFS